VTESNRIRPAFVIFHLILGLALLWSSVHTLLHLGPTDVHARIIGSIEAVGAVAFLIPRTLRFGGPLLLLSLVGAILVHAGLGEWRPDLLVYAAGVALVTVHGSAYQHAPGVASAA
jgi:hypothetical protein